MKCATDLFCSRTEQRKYVASVLIMLNHLPFEASHVQEEWLLIHEVLEAEDVVIADLAGVAERRGWTPVDVEIVHPEVICLIPFYPIENTSYDCN